MGDYCSTTHVEAHMGGRAFNSTAIVTDTQADAWINHAERQLIGTLAAVGGSSDYTADTTHALLIIRDWVAIYVAGLARRSYAAAAGDGQNEDGQDEIEGWNELLQDIRRDPAHYIQMLTAAANSSSNHLSAHCDSDDADTANFLISEVF